MEFALEWRKLYQPSMEEVRSGRGGWTVLDVLHRESLDKLIARYAIKGLSEADIDYLNRAWHRLDPWPDAVEGLTRLKRSFIIAPCSNGNIALIVNMAKHAGLPWDCVLGAETARAYKPMPEAYLAACRQLGLAPAAVMMVAAHNRPRSGSAVRRPGGGGLRGAREKARRLAWRVQVSRATGPLCRLASGSRRLAPAAGFGPLAPSVRFFNPTGVDMSDQKQAAQGSAATARTSTPFKDMTPDQKVKFIFKLAICIISFGMIFPNVMSD